MVVGKILGLKCDRHSLKRKYLQLGIVQNPIVDIIGFRIVRIKKIKSSVARFIGYGNPSIKNFNVSRGLMHRPVRQVFVVVRGESSLIQGALQGIISAYIDMGRHIDSGRDLTARYFRFTDILRFKRKLGIIYRAM